MVGSTLEEMLGEWRHVSTLDEALLAWVYVTPVVGPAPRRREIIFKIKKGKINVLLELTKLSIQRIGTTGSKFRERIEQI